MKWISVKERLPTHEQIVDIFTNSNERVTDVLFADSSNYDFDTINTIYFYDDAGDYIYYLEEVTHWMSRPEPPEKN